MASHEFDLVGRCILEQATIEGSLVLTPPKQRALIRPCWQRADWRPCNLTDRHLGPQLGKWALRYGQREACTPHPSTYVGLAPAPIVGLGGYPFDQGTEDVPSTASESRGL